MDVFLRDDPKKKDTSAFCPEALVAKGKLEKSKGYRLNSSIIFLDEQKKMA